MAFEKMKLDIGQVSQFQTDLTNEPTSNIELLTGGEWSQAFGYTQGGKDYVIRFNPIEDDFLHDIYAGQFNAENLPIPRIIRTGTAFDGHFAIAERVSGTMLDDLDTTATERTLPSIMLVLDALREADISGSSGFGLWNELGNGAETSWRNVLLGVGGENYDSILPGWRNALEVSTYYASLFRRGYLKLTALAEELPETRALIHNDLLHRNVLTNDGRIVAVLDWGFAMYGDFLHDLAQFVFWAPIKKGLSGVDWEAETRTHYEELGIDIQDFERRLKCSLIYLGLDLQTFYAYKEDWRQLKIVADRTAEIL